jgi:hypothetical protein
VTASVDVPTYNIFIIVIKVITESMYYTQTCKPDRHSTDQEILRLLLYILRVRMSRLLYSIISHWNPFYTHITHSFEIHCNAILTRTRSAPT